MMEQVMWSPGVTMEMIEKQVILKAYKFYRGNATQAAISLGLSEKTVRNKLEKYEQDGERQREAERLEDIERAKILDRARGIIPESKSEVGGARIYGASSGVQVEPSLKIAAEPPVPVPVREEVQKVLPKHNPKSSKQRRRA